MLNEAPYLHKIPDLRHKRNRSVLKDNHGRIINYLRLAVTDRCNLRCFYCMPEEGINWLERKELMTFAEMNEICTLLVNNGIDKIRITGGEPFVRKDIMGFMAGLAALPRLKELTITTNGVLTAPYVPELAKLGIRSVNLSMDTLDRNRFFSITHRDELPAVLATLDALLAHNIAVKINAVVMDGRNIDDIIPLTQLTKDLPVSVRFIEEMPFNGGEDHYTVLKWDHARILSKLQENFPGLTALPSGPGATAANYAIPGHKGTVGIIAAYTRSFCGTCNRIRITPDGLLKTCLYDGGVLNIKDLMRQGHTSEMLMETLTSAMHSRAKDGWEAERISATKSSLHQSMARIGG